LRAEQHSLRYEPGFDGVRGLAIALVLLYHFTRETALARSDAFFARFVLAGWCGVDLFFVLSGFLITTILLRTVGERDHFKRFYIRRSLRILPLYYGTLAVVLLILPRVLPVTPEIRRILDAQHALWLYYMNYMPVEFDAAWMRLAHFWSLVVEEQFYLVWPVALAIAGARRMKALLIAGIVFVFALQFGILFADIPLADRMHAVRPLGLVAGALLALWRPADAHEHKTRGPGWMNAVAILAATAVVVMIASGGFRELPHSSQDSAVAAVRLAVFGALVVSWVWIVDASRRDGLAARFFSLAVLRSFGKYSYGMYVLHYLLLPLFVRWFGRGLVFVVLSIAATYGVAMISYHLFEKRFLAWKERLAPVRIAPHSDPLPADAGRGSKGD